MYRFVTRAAKISLCATAIAGSLLAAGMAAAAPQTQAQQPRVFAPHCAARPRCVSNVCARSGRCLLGNHVVMSGCLIYTCTRGTR
jgi:hypothetical protein